MEKKNWKDQMFSIISAADGARVYLDTDRPYYAFKSIEKVLALSQELLEKAKYYKTDKPIEWIDNLEA